MSLLDVFALFVLMSVWSGGRGVITRTALPRRADGVQMTGGGMYSACPTGPIRQN